MKAPPSVSQSTIYTPSPRAVLSPEAVKKRYVVAAIVLSLLTACIGCSHLIPKLDSFWSAHETIQIALTTGLSAACLLALSNGLKGRTRKVLATALIVLIIVAVGGALASECTHFPYDKLIAAGAFGFIIGSAISFIAINPKALSFDGERIRRELFWKLYDICGSLKSSTVPLYADDIAQIKQLEDSQKTAQESATSESVDDDFEAVVSSQAPPSNDMILAAIKQLQTTSNLSSAAILEYGKYLEKGHPEFLLIDRYLLPQGRYDLSTIPAGKTKIALPVILEGAVEDHIVTFFVDTTTNIIEYYDSKGLKISDRDEVLVNGQGLRLSDVLDQLKTRIRNPHIAENTEKHQFNCYDCGVYVLHYIEKRLADVQFQTLFNRGVTTDQITKKIRPEMIRHLLCP
jgi:hypothetical protein